MQRSGAGAERKNAGRYELLLKAWEGDPGTVWAARATDAEPPGELVLVHDLPAAAGADERVADALMEAWEWTADARHEGIVNAEEPIIDDVGVAIVSPYLEGEPLGSLLRLASVRRLVFPAPAALRVAVDILEAVSYLHGRAAEMSILPAAVFGGLHPNQVLVGADGRTRILEPGISAMISHEKVFADDPKRAAYAAPEQLAAGEQSDATTDLFAIGILLWEQMLGKRLFGALSLAAVTKKVTGQPIDRLDASKPAGGAEIDKAVADVVEHALQRSRADRYQSAGEMLEAILSCGQPVGSHEDVAKVLEQLAGKALAARKSSVEKALVAGPAAAAAGAPDSRRSPTPGPAAVAPPKGAPAESDPDAGRKKAPPPPRVGGAPQPPRVKPTGPRPGAPAPRAGDGIEDPQTYEGELVEDAPAPPRRGAAKPSDPKRASTPGDKPAGTEWEGPISEQSDVPASAEDEGDAGEDEEMPTALISPEQAASLTAGIGAATSGAAAGVPRPGAAKAATPPPPIAAADKATDARFDDSAHRTEDDDEPAAPDDLDRAGAEDVEEVDDAAREDGLKDDAAPWGDDDGGGEPAPASGKPAAAAKPEADKKAAEKPAAAAPAADVDVEGGEEPPAGSKKKLIIVGAAAAAVVVLVGVLATTGGGETPAGSTTSAAATTEVAVTTTPTPTPTATETATTETTTTETATEEADAGAAPETTAEPTTTPPPTTPAVPGTGQKPPRKPKDKPPPRYVPNDL